MNKDSRAGLILAAGKGTRMHSELPKVLQTILGEPMLYYVYQALTPLFQDRLFTVVGHGAETVERAFPEHAQRFIRQTEQLGTGHALQTAWPVLKSAGTEICLVINGDTPLISQAAVQDLIAEADESGAALAFLTVTLEDPGDLGRVVRKDGQVRAIIEAKDYDPGRHGPPTGEVNAGIYCLRMPEIEPLLGRLTNKNKSGEFYITDLVDLAREAGGAVVAVNAGTDPSLLGINSPFELVAAEAALADRLVYDWLASGVIIRSPESVRLGPRVKLAPGAQVCGPCEIYGSSEVGPEVRVDSHVVMTDSILGKGAWVRNFSHLEDAVVSENAVVGPFARLRPGAVLEENARVGNFVEMKKAVLRKGAKANHLTYLGDAEVGQGANIGAGTITCNYDGYKKHKTEIGEGAFIGSNTALVAPVKIGTGSVVGAGSTITKNVPDNSISLTRPEQVTKPRRRRKP